MSGSIQSIVKSDILNASVGGLPPQDPLGQICYYTSVEFNLGKANFIYQSIPQDNELLKLRLNVMSGDFAKAREVFKKVDKFEDNDTKADYCLAETQTLCHEGQWVGAVSVAEKGLRLSPAVITQISLIQCRAIALYELGELNKALKDCEMVLSQQKLYNRAVAVKYSKILKAKIYLAMGETERATSLARSLFQFSDNEPLDIDLLLSLLRLKIDTHRSLQKPISHLASACFVIANALQDPLYAAMAEFDFYTAAENPDFKLRNPLVQKGQSFAKLKHWLANFDAKVSRSTSEQRHLLTVKENRWVKNSEPIRFLISEEGYLFDLNELRSYRLKTTLKLAPLVQTMQNGPIERSCFFENIWKQKYNYEKHDGVIRSFLYRLRKNTPLQISSHSGKIHFDAALFF